MKTNYPMMRFLFALIVGLILVIWPNDAANFIVITIGVLFLITGIISVIGYAVSRSKKNAPTTRMPFEGVGSLLFGLWLVIMPGFFTNIIMFLLGFILILAGIFQIATLASARKSANIPAALFIIPSLVLIAGVIVVLSPTDAVHTAFLIIGVSSLIYSVSELINMFKFNKVQQVEVAEPAEVKEQQKIE